MAIRGQTPARDIDVEDFSAPDGRRLRIQPEVPNRAVTYRGVGPTLAVVVRGVVLLVVVRVWLWRR